MQTEILEIIYQGAKMDYLLSVMMCGNNRKFPISHTDAIQTIATAKASEKIRVDAEIIGLNTHYVFNRIEDKAAPGSTAI